jgi:hypothetical protein
MSDRFAPQSVNHEHHAAIMAKLSLFICSDPQPGFVESHQLQGPPECMRTTFPTLAQIDYAGTRCMVDTFHSPAQLTAQHPPPASPRVLAMIDGRQALKDWVKRHLVETLVVLATC